MRKEDDTLKLRHIITIALVLFFAACDRAADNHHTTDVTTNVTTRVTVVEIPHYYTEDPNPITTETSPEPQFFPDYVVNLDIEPYVNTVNGAMRVYFKNTSAHVLDRVLFSLPFNAFAHDLPHSPPMDIQRATINLNPADFSVEGPLLTIYLEEDLAPGQQSTIGIIFEAYIPHAGHRTGSNDYALWFGSFLPTLVVLDDQGWHHHSHYPVGHPFFSAVANYQVTITTPDNFSVVTPGSDIRLARDFAFAVLSDAYNYRRITTDNGMDIAVYYHSEQSAATDIDALLATARAAFDYYTARVGALPYQSFNIIETELFRRDSIKFPGITFVDSRIINTGDVHRLITRDIGHQWFYDVVGHNPITQPWLAHGLVGFLQMGFANPNDISIHAHMMHASLLENMAYLDHPQLSRGLSYQHTWQDFHRVHHQRGTLLFYALWQKMGPNAFDEFVRSYYQHHAFSIATADGLIDLAEEIHGAPLRGFFALWINSSTLPPLPYSP